MESILLKVAETENLGFNYVFIVHDSANDKAILRCSQEAQGFVDESFYIQDFLEYFKKLYSLQTTIKQEDGNYSNIENIPINISEEIVQINSRYREKISIDSNISYTKNQNLNVDCITNKLTNKKFNKNHKKNNLFDSNDNNIFTKSIEKFNSSSVSSSNDISTPSHFKSRKHSLYKDNNVSSLRVKKLPQKERYSNENKIETSHSDFDITSVFLNDDNISEIDTAKFQSNICQEYDKVKSLFKAVIPIFEDGFDNETFVNNLNNIVYECSICAKVYKTADNAEMHCWIHQKDYRDGAIEEIKLNPITLMYQCNFCDRFFSDLSLLNLHAWIHTNTLKNKNLVVEKFECSICSKMFQSQENLKKHNYNVHVDGFSACVICGKLIRTRKIKEHLTKVHGNSRLKCTKCPKKFKGSKSLKMHLEDHAAEEAGLDNTFECIKCHKTFMSEVRLRVHYKRNCDEAKMMQHSILCPVCGHNFSSNLTLSVHLRMKHSNVGLSGVVPLKKFKCTICERIYHSKSKLKEHLRCHTGEKPYKCENCGKAFTYKHYLRKHNRNLVCSRQ